MLAERSYPPGDVRVLAETTYPTVAAGARVRVADMGTHLAGHGIELSFQPSMTDDDYALITQSGFSGSKGLAVWRGVRRASRIDRSADDMLTLVHRLRTLVPWSTDREPLDVYDFDDALYVGPPISHHHILGAFKRERSRCLRYMRSARVVIAGNRVLADFARTHAARVEIVPSCIDPSVQEARVHGDTGCLTLGWTGSSTTSPYLVPLLDLVASLHARGRQVRLLLMGADQSLTAPWIEHRSWSVAGERQMLTEIDVGVMPLPDNPWTQGKCGYKLLRYFAAGLPVIASPVGANADLVAEGRGIGASSPAEWEAAIEEIGREADIRRQMGSAARGFVEREYSYQVWAPRLAELLRDLTR